MQTKSLPMVSVVTDYKLDTIYVGLVTTPTKSKISMTKPIGIGLSLLIVIMGWLMIGFGYTTTLGHPVNTILFLLGIGVFMGGIVAALIWKRKR